MPKEQLPMTDFDSSLFLSRRRFLAVSGGAGAAALLAACGGTSSPTAAQAPAGGNGGSAYTGPNVTLAFWNGFTGGDGTYIKKIVDDFNKATPNVKVTMNVYQWADFFQKVPAAVASGNGPDVGAMHVDDIPTNAARNIIVPIDDVAKALNLSEADFSPIVWQGGVYKDKRYGIPLDSHSLGMYYNKAVLQKAGLDPEKPPQTGDDYLAALEQIKGKAKIQGHWMTPFPFTGTFQFESLLWQFGGELFDDGITKATFDSDAGVQALTWLRSLITKGYSPANVGQDADYIALKNAKNAFNWNGIWQINDLASISGLQWGAAPIPKVGTQNAVWANSHQFVVMRQNQTDQNKQAASRYFINWVSQRSLEWAKSGKIPARKSVLESADFKALAPEAQFAKQVDYLHFPPQAPGIADALALVDTAVNQAILGKKQPADALSAAATQATKVVQDNAKKYGG
jgi:multiple sugar transport system substrate-binding protein